MNLDIKHKIQYSIDRLLNDPHCKDRSWYEIRDEISKARTVFGMFDEVHEVLLPFYKRYMMADQAFFKDREHGRRARDFMSNLLKEEHEYFFASFNDIDLVECAKNWSKYPEIEKHLDQSFSAMLSTLLKGGYRPDIPSVKKKLCSRLGYREEYGDYKELEMYCILMAHLLVYEKNLCIEDKEKYYMQIFYNWGFLKYMYSFMLAHVIGMKHMYFSHVISSLVRGKQYYPHIHIAYKAAKQNLKRLYADGKMDHFAKRPVNEVIDEKMVELEQIVKQNARNDDIVPLCKILFPKKIEELLDQYCPPTYEQLEHDIADLNNKYEDMVKKIVVQFSASVSIEEIEEAFAKFNANLALSFYGTINTLLAQNDTWRKYAPQIQQHILDRQEKEKIESAQTIAKIIQGAANPIINNTFEKGSCNFNSGSTMNGRVSITQQ